MHNGLKVRLGQYHGAWMTEIIRALKGHHEPQEERIFHEVLKVLPEGALMMEAGSYWAYYSMWFQSRVKNGRAFMLEPIAFKLQTSIDNFRLNGMQGAFHNVFVGAVSAERARFVDWDGSVLQLRCVAIDDFLDQEGVMFLDILHADIQGAELEMLKGCARSLAANRIGYLFISTHPGMHEPCLAYLRQSGYRVVFEHSVEESCSGDGLIVARGARAPQMPSVEVTRNSGPGRIHESVGGLVELLTRRESRRLWAAIRSER
jgi:FkbM family methyltransferase